MSKEHVRAERVSDIPWSAWTPVDVATLLFVIDGDNVLLIRKKRGLGRGLVNAPGGRVDPGETPREAAVREVREELCIEVREPDWRGEHRFQFRDGYSMIVHVYVSRAWQGDATETDEAVPLWVRKDAVPYDEMWEDDAHWLPLLFEGVRFSGRYIFDGSRMLDIELDHLEAHEPDRDDWRRPLTHD